MNKNLVEILAEMGLEARRRQVAHPLAAVTGTADGLDVEFTDGSMGHLPWAAMRDPEGNQPASIVFFDRFSVVMKNQKGERAEAPADLLHLLIQPDGGASLERRWACLEYSVGHAMKMCRENLGMSIQELAERVASSAVRIKAIERGAYASALELCPLLLALDARLPELFSIQRLHSGEIRQRFVDNIGPKVVS